MKRSCSHVLEQKNAKRACVQVSPIRVDIERHLPPIVISLVDEFLGIDEMWWCLITSCDSYSLSSSLVANLRRYITQRVTCRTPEWLRNTEIRKLLDPIVMLECPDYKNTLCQVVGTSVSWFFHCCMPMYSLMEQCADPNQRLHSFHSWFRTPQARYLTFVPDWSLPFLKTFIQRRSSWTSLKVVDRLVVFRGRPCGSPGAQHGLWVMMTPQVKRGLPPDPKSGRLLGPSCPLCFQSTPPDGFCCGSLFTGQPLKTDAGTLDKSVERTLRTWDESMGSIFVMPHDVSFMCSMVKYHSLVRFFIRFKQLPQTERDKMWGVLTRGLDVTPVWTPTVLRVNDAITMSMSGTVEIRLGSSLYHAVRGHLCLRVMNRRSMEFTRAWIRQPVNYDDFKFMLIECMRTNQTDFTSWFRNDPWFGENRHIILMMINFFAKKLMPIPPDYVAIIDRHRRAVFGPC